MKNPTHIPWHIRVAKAAAKLTPPSDDELFELPDFAPEPTDPETLDEIMEAEGRKVAMLMWELEDDPAFTLDEFGNPIPKTKAS